jgi:hypothetical protein
LYCRGIPLKHFREEFNNHVIYRQYTGFCFQVLQEIGIEIRRVKQIKVLLLQLLYRLLLVVEYMVQCVDMDPSLESCKKMRIGEKIVSIRPEPAQVRLLVEVIILRIA